MVASHPAESVLEMERVGKRFGQVWVLKDVNLEVRRGSIHAIVGHNGAGKSTLMKIALGAVTPTEGEVRVAGQKLTFSRPAEARMLGLGMVMQERSLIRTLNGLNNLYLNAEHKGAMGLIDVRRQRVEIATLLEELAIPRELLSTIASDMSTIEQELIEIARALRLGSQVLILDEPTAPLGREEITRLFGVLRTIAARGAGIVIITHHLAEVFAVSDTVTCLREGEVVLQTATKEINMSALISAMLGRRPWEGSHLAAHGAKRVRCSSADCLVSEIETVAHRSKTRGGSQAYGCVVRGFSRRGAWRRRTGGKRAHDAVAHAVRRPPSRWRRNSFP